MSSFGRIAEFFSALRFAAREPQAQGRVFSLSLPSAYPFSAQARLGPRWANLFSRLTALHCYSDNIVICPLEQSWGA